MKLKKLNSIFKNFRKKQLLLCIVITTEICLSAYIPFLIKDLVDTITHNNNINSLLNITYSLLLLTIINVFIGNFNHYIWHKLRLQSVNFLRLKMFEATLKKPKYFFDSKSTGEIMDDTSIVAQNIIIGPPMLFSNVLNFIIIVCVLFTLSKKLTFLILLILPVYMLGFHYFNKKIRKTSRSERENFGFVMKDAEEKLQGINTIKTFKINTFMTEIFEKKLKNHFKFLSKNLFYNSLGSSLNNLIISLLPILILIYGSILINKNQLSLGTLIAFFTYISNIYEPLSNLSDYNLGLQSSLAIGDRIINFLDLDSSSKNANKKTINSFESLEFVDVSFAYKDKNYVLKDFNFKINKGDHIGIVGKSGCGKSTFLKLLLGMYYPTSGKILINDIDIREVDLNSFYSVLAIQEQLPFIFEGTLEENLTLGSNIPKSFIDKIIKDIQISDINNSLDKISLNTLSVGQKQRICMDRALLKNPEILILDEPTSALDCKLEETIQKNLESLTENKTVLLITHRPALLKNCTTLLNLENITLQKSTI